MSKYTKVPEESLIRIFVNGEFFSALLCSPRQTEELTVGWLFNQGYIESIEEVVSIQTCDDSKDVKISLASRSYETIGQDKLIRTVACMGGEISYSQFFANRRKLKDGPRSSLQALQCLMKETTTKASFYREKGGTHWASVVSITQDRVLECFEDVGRHNAVDKIVGRMMLTRQSFDDKALLTSGRISSEMALKAAKAQIPLIATITSCTDLAVQIAEDAGLTVVCRALSTSPMIWCGPQRIIDH